MLSNSHVWQSLICFGCRSMGWPCRSFTMLRTETFRIPWWRITTSGTWATKSGNRMWWTWLRWLGGYVVNVEGFGSCPQSTPLMLFHRPQFRHCCYANRNISPNWTLQYKQRMCIIYIYFLWLLVNKHKCITHNVFFFIVNSAFQTATSSVSTKTWHSPSTTPIRPCWISGPLLGLEEARSLLVSLANDKKQRENMFQGTKHVSGWIPNPWCPRVLHNILMMNISPFWSPFPKIAMNSAISEKLAVASASDSPNHLHFMTFVVSLQGVVQTAN